MILEDTDGGAAETSKVFYQGEDINSALGITVLGNNFRNPYELAIDSYGGLWQSDNDDDGNRGVRINFVKKIEYIY